MFYIKSNKKDVFDVCKFNVYMDFKMIARIINLLAIIYEKCYKNSDEFIKYLETFITMKKVKILSENIVSFALYFCCKIV